MSSKPTELGYHKKDIGRCRFCQETILWGYMFGKKHPYDVVFDADGTPRKNGSHMDTCPDWKSRHLSQADTHTAAIQKWQESCQLPDVHPPIDYKTVELFEDVPEKHAKPTITGSMNICTGSRCPSFPIWRNASRYPSQATDSNRVACDNCLQSCNLATLQACNLSGLQV